jgi:hypothetical protein
MNPCVIRPKNKGITMRSCQFLRVIPIAAILFVASVGGRADLAPLEIAGKSLPGQLGSFRATGPVLVAETHSVEVVSSRERYYRSVKGDAFSVLVLVTGSDSHAYALLTSGQADNGSRPPAATREIGALGYIGANSISFIKGPVFITVSAKGNRVDSTAMLDLARQSASLLENGEADIPVLVKHLPDWEKAQAQARYALDPAGLKRFIPDQPILEALSFDGGAEAVVAPYGASKLLIVEFTTPQLAGDNDRRIVARIQELWKQGQPAPTAYRRVGNYSVFVFNAPNEQTANQLIDQVKYEQVVQWLGDNPNLLERAQRYYTETLLGTFIAVIKASGLAAVLCFGVGGFFGALLFARRRAQQKTVETYSDAGGMTRLNLDELTVETNTARLLGPQMSDKA